jgi:hypothetical protein
MAIKGALRKNCVRNAAKRVRSMVAQKVIHGPDNFDIDISLGDRVRDIDHYVMSISPTSVHDGRCGKPALHVCRLGINRNVHLS